MTKWLVVLSIVFVGAVIAAAATLDGDARLRGSSSENSRDVWEYRLVDASNLYVEQKQQLLNRLGGEGWELFSASSSELIFKRKK
jgi:hypothetical protein